MQHKRLISALKKDGAIITSQDNHRFIAMKGMTVVDWVINGNMHDGDGQVCGVRKRSPHTNSSVDEFHDHYIETIKGSIKALNSPPLT